jgi:uncharacterized protein YjbI with pentapeptide repeats
MHRRSPLRRAIPVLAITGLITVAILIHFCPQIKYVLKQWFPGKTGWDYWSDIIIPVISGLFSGAPLAIFAAWSGRQMRVKEKAERKEREEIEKAAKEEREQNRADERRAVALQLYFDRINEMLVNRQLLFLEKSARMLGKEYEDPVVESAKVVIRARTLSILRFFSGDTEKKSAVLHFLIESEILPKLSLSLSEADLSGVYLNWPDLTQAQLTRANLAGMKLIGAMLYKAHLNNSRFNEANLCRAILYLAELHGADLTGADLRGAKLSGAFLLGANLSHADLRGADLGIAHLANGESLGGAHLNGANLEHVKWDEDTIWPNLDRFCNPFNISPELKNHLGLT